MATDCMSKEVLRRHRFVVIAVLLGTAATTGFLIDGKAPTSDKQNSKFSHDPDSAQIVTSDIENFWRAYDHIGADNAAEILQKEYLDPGSVGLHDFLELRIKSARDLAGTIRQRTLYYKSIRATTVRVSSFVPLIRASFHHLKDLYSDAVFPGVYFVIGSMNSGGTTSDHGLLIGTEMYGRTPDMPTAELDAWHKQVLKPIEELPGIVAHELIHFQQKIPPKWTLLASAIQEGSADFLGEMISGLNINSHLLKYGNDRERELWSEFKPAMLGSDTSKWLAEGANAKERPADLGYYIGYRIAQSYYEHASDKKQAIREILQVQDCEEFLKKSKYEEKFRTTQPIG